MLFTAALLGVLLLFDEICSNERHLTLLAVVFGGLIGIATLLRPTAISSPRCLLQCSICKSEQSFRRSNFSLYRQFLPSSFSRRGQHATMPCSVNLCSRLRAVAVTCGWATIRPLAGFYQKPPDHPGLNEVQLDHFSRTTQSPISSRRPWRL